MVTQDVFIYATTTLTVELIVLSLLIVGYSLKAKQRYRQHGITMTAAVALHMIPIFAWMVVSFIIYATAAPLNLATATVQITLAHLALGTSSAALGIFLVASWHLQINLQKCFARKRVMLLTITLWLATVALGVYLFWAVITA